MHQWNLQKLGHFLEVAQAGSVSEAARVIGISQPALTTSIRKLEREMGFDLFDRERGFELTNMGAELLVWAEDILSQIAEMDRKVEGLRAGSMGELRVASGPTVADGLLGVALGRMMSIAPDARIDVKVTSPSEFHGMLERREIDLAVGETSDFTDLSHYEVIPLEPQEIIFFCRAGHPLSGREKVNPKEFFSYPHVATELPPHVLSWLGKARPADSGHAGLSLSCSHHALLKRVVEGSDALSGAPWMVIKPEIEAGRFAKVNFKVPPISSQASVIFRSGRKPSPLASRLIELLRESAGCPG